MAQEIELKLSLPEGEQRRFVRTPLLRGAVRDSGHLINVYYDTPDLALHCNGIALRLRKSRQRWLQTVKCAGVSHAGLSSRPEWETVYSGEFDFGAVDDPATRKLLERLKTRLLPVFETNFLRTTWQVREAGTELIVALDRGTIVANGAVAGISEIEIEIGGSGEVDAIFALTDRLARQFTLTPGQSSKAERGYDLFVGRPATPYRAVPVKLDNTMAPLAAFRQIALSCLDHLQQNHHGATHSDDTEYIHQMRVAMRRLRAAIGLFAPVLPDRFNAALLPPLQELMAVLGNARDFDILTGEIVDPVAMGVPAEPRISALSAIVAEHRQRARETATSALNSPAYGQLLLLAMGELNRLADSHDEEVHDADQDIVAFANARLKHLRRKVVRLLRAARPDNPASLHKLRIAGKRLRYALEFFSSLLPARRSASLLKRLIRLQNNLGQLNDLANAGHLLMNCAGDEAELREAVSLIGGWHGRRYADLLQKLPTALNKLHTSPLPKAE